MRRTLLLTLFLLVGGALRADALTIRDIIELTKAGLSDEVLLALIDVDGGVYANDPETLKALKQAGVSERVMVALVRSGRERRPEPSPAPAAAPEEQVPAAQPQVIVIEHREPETQQVMVPVPVYVPVYTSGRTVRRSHAAPSRPVEEFVPFQSAPPLARPEPAQPAKPVYWGFGGNLRPDAWGQPREKAKAEDGDGKGGRR